HVEQPVGVGFVGGRGGGADMAVRLRVAAGELALPDIHPVLAVRHEVLSPGERVAFAAASRGELPFRLGGETDAGPRAERLGVVPADVDGRVVHTVADGAFRTFRVSPVGAEDLLPPGRAGRGRVALEGRRQELPEYEGPAEGFGLGAVACRLDEFR